MKKKDLANQRISSAPALRAQYVGILPNALYHFLGACGHSYELFTYHAIVSSDFIGPDTVSVGKVGI
jgi:hypothetical protein